MFGVWCNLHYLLNRAGGRIQRDLNKSPETTEADGLELGEGCSEKQQGSEQVPSTSGGCDRENASPEGDGVPSAGSRTSFPNISLGVRARSRQSLTCRLPVPRSTFPTKARAVSEADIGHKSRRSCNSPQFGVEGRWSLPCQLPHLMSNGPGGEGRVEEELEENGREMFGPCSGNVQNMF